MQIKFLLKKKTQKQGLIQLRETSSQIQIQVFCLGKIKNKSQFSIDQNNKNIKTQILVFFPHLFFLFKNLISNKKKNKHQL